MQLRLKGTGAGETVRLESTLDGFDEIAERVAGVARKRADDLSSSKHPQIPMEVLGKALALLTQSLLVAPYAH